MGAFSWWLPQREHHHHPTWRGGVPVRRTSSGKTEKAQKYMLGIVLLNPSTSPAYQRVDVIVFE